jgi:hypothetical protein
MQETHSPQDAVRLQRAVLALAFEVHPSRLHREHLERELGETEEVAAAIRFLVGARLLRWENETLALTAPALVFEELAF